MWGKFLGLGLLPSHVLHVAGALSFLNSLLIYGLCDTLTETVEGTLVHLVVPKVVDTFGLKDADGLI